jgi:inhibitor of KinA sporulation pathway (predicted exonuclease)
METDDCLIVVDVEATCDDGGRIPPHEMEIIEIGAVKVRISDGEMLGSFHSLVRPTQHPKLTDFCRRLTGIQQNEVDRAQPFANVLVEFQSWLNHPFWNWASWGDFDCSLLQRELERMGEDPIFAEHLNLKAIAKDAWGLKKTGMKEVLRQQGLAPIGTHHRALDDAKSIAQLVPLMRTAIKSSLDSNSSGFV